MTLMQWVYSNKSLVLLSLLTFCFFVSTLALSVQKKSNGSACTNYKKETPMNTKNSYYRLPKHVVPVNYKLKLYPNMTTKTFDGSVTISLNIFEPTENITLHSNQLIIGKTILNTIDNRNVPINSNEMPSDKRELLIINLQNKVPMGSYALYVEFRGKLDKKIIGFYASTLKDGSTMVASKFQPTYARQAFPCFDEPDFKATYDVTLVKPPTYVALSNMNEISRTLDEKQNVESVTFARSVPMSTYLACFVVCDFDYKEVEINSNSIGNNFKLRSFAQKNQMHTIDFAQDIGKRATEYYIKYYEVPFPLPKLDMIAIPDYVSGATEHWGLITYRETSFLVNEATASAQNKISVANTIAHELAHMWFGNLVTMKWWDEVWLNEGFASYMQVKSLNALEPSWTMLDQFLTKTLHSVLLIDAKLSSHPIVQTVATPDQITAIFDSISYNKGASVLRMLEGFIGEENFRRGVSDYLKKHQFGNTITQDLLSSLEPYFRKDNPTLSITHIMDTWTRQAGYPVVRVARAGEPHSYVLTHSRFLLDPKATYTNDSPFDYRWYIPITYKTNKGENGGILWFPNDQDSVKITLKEGENWLKINNNQVGYYRVNYPLDMWENLIQQLRSGSAQLTISDRAHLLNDVFALAEARALPYDLALNLTTYLTNEVDFVPWSTAATIFSDLSGKLQHTSARDDLEKYMRRLVEPLYSKQTWDRTKHTVIAGLLRTQILSLATRCGLSDAVNKVRSLFVTWLDAYATSTAVDIEPDLRDLVYYHGMKSASEAEWDKLWKIYLNETDAQEQAKLRRALAAPTDTAILSRYLTLAWDETKIRSQDYLTVLHVISDNPSGTDIVWDHVRTRWPQLVDRFTLNSRYLGGLVPSVTDSFNTDAKLKEMEAFFKQYPEAGAGETARRRALETVHNNILWTQTQLPSVAAWLTTQHL